MLHSVFIYVLDRAPTFLEMGLTLEYSDNLDKLLGTRGKAKYQYLMESLDPISFVTGNKRGTPGTGYQKNHGNKGDNNAC